MASCRTERSTLLERALANILPLRQCGPGHLCSGLQTGRASCPRDWLSRVPFTEALRALSAGPGRTVWFPFQAHRPVLSTLCRVSPWTWSSGLRLLRSCSDPENALASEAEPWLCFFPVTSGCLLG